MSFKKRATTVAAAVTGMMAAASPAYAIGLNVNDQPTGVNMLNNVSVLPVQTCGAVIDILGLPLPLTGQSTAAECVNAPVHDEDQAIVTGSEIGG